jgi:hypothetical protein
MRQCLQRHATRRNRIGCTQSVDAPIERMMHRTWLVDEDRDESGTSSLRSLWAGGLSNGAFCMGATWMQNGCNMVVPFHVACSASNVA